MKMKFITSSLGTTLPYLRKNPPAYRYAGGFERYSRDNASKFVTERELDFLGSVEDVRSSSKLGARLAKGIAGNATIAASEGVTVKSICEVHFEGQNMSFIQR